MISFIKGTIVDIEDDKIILECNGIGYNIFVPTSLISKAGRTGVEIKIFTYLSVREDAMTLFGFLSKDDLNIFKQLISVSGIGPKGALGILSTLTVEQLKLAIIADDAKAIAKSPGIGGKTASKLILELKDKINLDNPFETTNTFDNSLENNDSSLQRDAIDALIALGYSSSQAFNAVKTVMNNNNEIKNASELIKLSLKNM